MSQSPMHSNSVASISSELDVFVTQVMDAVCERYETDTSIPVLLVLQDKDDECVSFEFDHDSIEKCLEEARVYVKHLPRVQPHLKNFHPVRYVISYIGSVSDDKSTPSFTLALLFEYQEKGGTGYSAYLPLDKKQGLFSRSPLSAGVIEELL